MGLLDFLVRHRVAPRSAVSLSEAGRPMFSLEQHLRNNAVPFAVGAMPYAVDHTHAMGWTPKNDSVFVLPLQEADRSRGGIITPDEARERPQKGVVLAVGAGLWDAEQEALHQVECGVGDLVTYGKFSGVAFEIEGIEILVIRNIELSARRHAGTYALTTHHVDVGGLGERRVYHEHHTYCAFCPKPASELIAEERARLVAENNAGLGLNDPAPEVLTGVTPLANDPPSDDAGTDADTSDEEARAAIAEERAKRAAAANADETLKTSD